MNRAADFKEWLSKTRFSRSVCMLIPMEACMGYPVVVERGEEYLIPFFRVASSEKTDKLSPPFAYLRIRYPSAAILTYNNLRTLPEWKTINWDVLAEKGGDHMTAAKLEEYYGAICRRENTPQSARRQDELLLDCLQVRSAGGSGAHPLAVWYKMLIAEAEKYR